uniref:putative UPF0481 protein At3g02645 n=1 Tax=Erigeron canadensis TaxID=72917 RepID=UPI001CB8D214|nr:putative UPF0481 protein At3g02645 [Erigeron canadensis]
MDTANYPPVSIFQTPESMKTQKPEAYEPQHIGLGPIHHFRPIPYKKTEQEKLAAVHWIVQCFKIKDFKIAILDQVQKLVPSVRASYDMFLQDDNVVLAWIFAIDSLFLLDLFYTTYEDKVNINNLEKNKQGRLPREKRYDVGDEINTSCPRLLFPLPEEDGYDSSLEEEYYFMVSDERVASSTSPSPRKEDDPKRRVLAKDVIMVENQIPFMILKEIHKTLNSSSSNYKNEESDQKISYSIFRTFCEAHSPLELCKPTQAPSHVQHLLDYMYYSIVNNYDDPRPTSNDIDQPVGFAFISFFTQIERKAKEEIIRLYKDTILILETFTVNVTAIPSASVLSDKLGFRFWKTTKHEGIQKIVIKDKFFYLPCITLKNDSEVILRNLVAYEMLVTHSENCPLIEYMRLMCELIVDVKDVKLLKEKHVIRGDLKEDDVVKLFIGMNNVVRNIKVKEKFDYLQKKRVQVKKVYESRLVIKAQLQLKKIALWLLVILRGIGGFVESSWKIVVFVIGIVTVFTLVKQAYCDSFGCGEKQLVDDKLRCSMFLAN